MQLLNISGKYRKNLVVFLLIASVPGIVFSFLLYFVSKGQMERELQMVHQNHLLTTIDTIKDEFSSMELLAANWAYNANKEDYSDLDRALDYQKIKDLYNRLSMMRGYNPFIGRVELYLDRPEPAIYTENGFILLDDDQATNYRHLLNEKQKMFWNQDLVSIDASVQERFAPLVMVHNLDNYRMRSFGSLIVFLEKTRLEQILKSPYEGGSAFMLRGNKQWLFENQEQTEPEPLQRKLMDEILDRTKVNSFVYHFDNIKYTVTYDRFTRLGEEWYFVSLAPLSTITAPVVYISKIFIYLNLLVFIIAILMSLFASKKLYAPIEELTSKLKGSGRGHANEFMMIETHLNDLLAESEDLQKRLEQQLPHLREGFILQLVQGYLYSYREEDLRTRLQQFGVEVNNKKYMITSVQLTGFKRVLDRFTEGDEGLVTFLAINIAEDLLRSFEMEADVLNFHDLSLGILLSFPSDMPSSDMDMKVHGFSEGLITHISKICKMNVSIGISRIAESLKAIPGIFEETRVALSFRNLQEENQIIDMKKKDFLNNSQEQFEYPFDLEKEILHAIRSRDETEAIQLIHTFVDESLKQNISEAAMRQSAFKLLGSIFHIVLQSGMIEDFAKEGAGLYEKLYKMKDPEEISHWFEKKVIIPIMGELSKKEDQRMRLSVQKVMHILEQRYMEDISLEDCASEVNLNSSFLSKIFKDISGWNFIDYLTNIRLTKAREILIETDTRIKDIAESVGYNQASYFNRIFKKEEGITPSEYREKYRKI